MRSISSQDKRTTFVAIFKKTVALLKNIRARWKTHNFRDNDVCVIVINHLSGSAKIAWRQIVVAKTVAPNSPIRTLMSFKSNWTKPERDVPWAVWLRITYLFVVDLCVFGSSLSGLQRHLNIGCDYAADHELVLTVTRQ